METQLTLKRVQVVTVNLVGRKNLIKKVYTATGLQCEVTIKALGTLPTNSKERITLLWVIKDRITDMSEMVSNNLSLQICTNQSN